MFDFMRIVVLFVFFFKQKTAYEMRISDWSSDVCSSDLIEPLDHGLHVPVGDFVPVEIMVMRHHNGHSKTSEGAPLLRPAAIAMRRSLAAVLHPVRDPRTRYSEKQLHCPVAATQGGDRKRTRLNSRHSCASRMLSSD